MKKWVLNIFAVLVVLALLTPFMVFRDLLFPYVTSKAFYFRIIVELAVPLYVYLILVDKQLRPKLKNFLNLSVIAFLVINIISAFVGVNVSRSLWGNFERMGGVFYIAHLVALFFYVQMLGQAGSVYLKRFLQGFVLVAVLVTLNGLSGWIGGPTLVQDPSLPFRVSSTFGNPIFFPSYLIIPMFIAAYFAVLEENKTLKIFYWIACGLQLIGIYSSGTRGAMVGLLAGLFVAAVLYVVMTSNEKVRKFGLAGIGVLIILAGVLYSYHSKLPAGSTISRLVNLRDSNTEARLLQWKTALTGFKEKPIFGVGSENYYVIFDKYFNPAMYQYDPSWFDKPHNFLIEVLTTNGAVGLLAYLAIFFGVIYGLWKAYRSGLLGLAELCLLVAALISYQVQNLTVFDTVSASVAFYAFLGLAAYMISESREENLANNKKFETSSLEGGFANTVLVIVSCVMIYVLYVGNITSMEASKRVNYGFAYADVNPKTAGDYFASALSLPFNLDPRETANRYSDFTSRLLMTATASTSPDFIGEQIDNSTKTQKAVAESVDNDPILWMRYANDQMNQALVRNTDVKVSIPAINKAIALAPKRVELLQLKIQLDGYIKDWADAAKTAQQIVEYNPFYPQYRWQLAMASYLSGNIPQAVKAGDEAVARGFTFTQLQQFGWYIQYYEQKKDWAKVAPLLEQAVKLQPNELNLYIDLAKAYAGMGDNSHARALAEQVAKSDPTQKAAMDAFIATLK